MDGAGAVTVVVGPGAVTVVVGPGTVRVTVAVGPATKRVTVRVAGGPDRVTVAVGPGADRVTVRVMTCAVVVVVIGAIRDRDGVGSWVACTVGSGWWPVGFRTLEAEPTTRPSTTASATAASAPGITSAGEIGRSPRRGE